MRRLTGAGRTRSGGVLPSASIVLVVLAAWGCRPPGGPGVRPGDPAPAATEPAAERPIGGEGMNVLFVSVDTTRADHIGCYGHSSSKTPNIDRLASEGARFVTCISSAPLTMPSHTTMMTGAYPFVHGVRDNGIFVLQASNRTLAEIFRDAGYATHAEVAAIVMNRKYGLDQGFDVYNDVELVEPKLELRPLQDQEQGALAAADQPYIEPELPEVEAERKAVEISDSGIAKLRELASADKPFFMFLHYFDPHWPWEAPEDLEAELKDPYLAEISYFDAQFGRVIDALRELGLAEKTLVILTSDHGEGRGEHGEHTHSTFLYDTTLHVPLILWCPGQVPAGRVVQTQVRLIDLAPTVLEFAGMAEEKSPQMQGQSLLPLLNDSAPDEKLDGYSDTMVPYTSYGYSWLRSLRTDEWKYILAPKPELYQVSSDPRELFNLADTHPDVATEMRQRLYDVIADAPPPPASRGGLIEMSDHERRKFEALGYVSEAMAADSALASGSELDMFEPRGTNPKDRTEAIVCVATGMGCFRVGDFNAAIRVWQRYIELEPDDWSGYSNLGQSFMAEGRYDDAIETFTRSMSLGNDLSLDRRMLGNAYAQKEQYEEAVRWFRDALSIDPADLIAQLNLGRVLRGLKRHDEALEAFDAAVALQPEIPDGYFERGATLRVLKRPEEALKDLATAARLGPTSASTHLQIAGIYMYDLNEPDRAIEGLKAALEQVSSPGLLHQALGECYTARGDFETALVHFEKFVEISPELPNPHRLKAETLVELGCFEDALAGFQQAVDLAPDFVMAWYGLADVYERMDRISDAADAYEHAIAEAPPTPVVYLRAADVMIRVGKSERAVEILSQGTELHPKNVLVANDLAWILATHPDDAIRDGARAVESGERAKELSGGQNAPVLDTLAAAYAEAGRFDDAVAAADQAVELANRARDVDLAARIGARRSLYAQQKPYREHLPQPTTAAVGATE